MNNQLLEFREMVREDTKEAAKIGAYDGVMQAKLELLSIEDNKDKKSPFNLRNLNLDLQNSLDSPLTMSEYKKNKKKELIFKIGAVSGLAVLGFVDFSDVINMLISLF